MKLQPIATRIWALIRDAAIFLFFLAGGRHETTDNEPAENPFNKSFAEANRLGEIDYLTHGWSSAKTPTNTTNTTPFDKY